MAHETDDDRRRHDAFLSYSRKDRGFAQQLEKALEGYRPPKELTPLRRHLDVFRDESDFTGPDYYSSLDEHLGRSTRLIVVCSPHARASAYVDDEIRRFAARQGARNIIPVIVAGLPHNEATAERQEESSFPRALCEVLELPLAVDFRGFNPARDRIRSGAFEGAWHTLLANVLGLSRAEVEQRERRRRARTRRAWSTLALALIIVLTAALVVTLQARREAVRQRDVAIQRQLVARAELLRRQEEHRNEEGILLGAEALRRALDLGEPPVEADQVLRVGLSLQLAPVRQIRQEGAVWAVAFAGKELDLLTGGGRAGGVRAYGTDGQLRYALPTPAVGKLVVDGAGRRVALIEKQEMGRPGKVVSVWTAPEAREITRLVHDEPVDDLSITADGQFVATASQNEVRIWSAADGREVTRTTLDDRVARVRFSGDGASLVTTSAAAERGSEPGAQITLRATSWRTAALVGAEGGSAWSPEAIEQQDEARLPPVEEVGLSRPRRDRLPALFVFSDDARLLLTLDRNAAFELSTTRLWERRAATSETSEVIVALAGFTQPRGITDVAFSPDGRHVATAGWDGTARVWEARTGVEVGRAGHGRVVHDLTFSPDGQQLATAGADGTARTWLLTSGELTRMVHGPGEAVRGLAFEGNGERLATRSARWLNVWDARRFSLLGRSHVLGSPLNATRPGMGASEHHPVFSAVTRVVAGGRRELVTLDLGRGGKEARVTVSPEAEGTVLSPDGSHAAASVGTEVRVLGLPQGESVTVLSHAGRAHPVAFSRHAERLATAEQGGPVRVWAIPAGREVARVPDVSAATADLDAAGERLATTSDGAACVFAVPGGARVFCVTLAEPAKGTAFSPSGRHLAIGAESGLRIVETTAGREVFRLGAGRQLTAVAFSADERYLAVASRGEAIRTGRVSIWTGWQTAGARELSRLPVTESILSLAFAPDGSRLATGSSDGVAQLWTVAPADLLAEACARVSRNLSAPEWRDHVGEEERRRTCPQYP